MPRITGATLTSVVSGILLSPISVVSVAAGGQATLDSPQIGDNKTGRLLGLIVSSSIAFKAEIRTVEASIPSVSQITWFALERGWDWQTPDRDLIRVAYTGLGLDAFRVIVTNLDTSQAADVYVAFIYEEVP